MIIYHAKIVTPSQVIGQGYVSLEGDTITDIAAGMPDYIMPGDINAGGAWLMPGLIDSHCDAIEVEMEPRPTSQFPIDFSFFELEKKLAAQGITTIYHALSLMNESRVRRTRSGADVLRLIERIHDLNRGHRLIRHKTHLRYELANTDAETLAHVEQLMKAGKIDEFSLMDHTPGQGQYRDIEVQKRLLTAHRHYSEQEAMTIIRESAEQIKLDTGTIRRLTGLAEQCGVAVASHDDDTIAKLDVVRTWNCSISEFPITLEAAGYARNLGMSLVMGAPNLLLGKSHSNNLSAREAVRHGLVDILCSDYYPPALLQAVFVLRDLGLTMPEAVNKVTHNPARALHLDAYGAIEIGKKADLLIVDEEERRPVLNTVIVGGQKTVTLNYHSKKLSNS